MGLSDEEEFGLAATIARLMLSLKETEAELARTRAELSSRPAPTLAGETPTPSSRRRSKPKGS